MSIPDSLIERRNKAKATKASLYVNEDEATVIRTSVTDLPHAVVERWEGVTVTVDRAARKRQLKRFGLPDDVPQHKIKSHDDGVNKLRVLVDAEPKVHTPRHRGGAVRDKITAHVFATKGVFLLSDVIKATEASSVTVRNIIIELVQAGSVEDLGPVKNPGKRGRPATQYQVRK